MRRNIPFVIIALTVPSLLCADEVLDSVAYPLLSTKQVMEWILDPATDVIWDSAGTIITEQGSQELAPTTEEGWEHVRNSAAVVAETGNLLRVPGRSLGPDWNKYSRGLLEAGQVALKAARAKDSDALFDAGGQLYQACLSRPQPAPCRSARRQKPTSRPAATPL